MNYEGEKFLLNLYKELYNKQSVKHSSTKSDNKYEVVKKYIERLERVHEKAINHKNDNGVKLLKSFYYDKYVIKKEDIPESYINYLDKVQFDQYGIHMNEYQKEEQKDLIIEDQKKSLDEWINYFTSEDAKFYPTWAKYWAFQGMLTIGNYDTNKGIYNKRSKTTVAPFPELDREVLSKSIDLVIKETNKEEIEEKDLEKLVKNGNFFKLYTVQLKDTRENNLGEETKGEWVKYEQGDNYQELHKSLQGKNTGWCTAGESTCKYQLKNGDFYVYYTYDEKGKATIPRLAIRMNGKNTIGEIRGVGKDQNIEPHFEDIIAKKLKGFPDADSYKKRVKDTQMLTYVYTKYENHKPLTKEDFNFIYEINNKIETMGWDMDPRLKELKNNIFKTATKEFTDKEFLIEILRKNGYLLEKVPKNKIGKEVALETVKFYTASIKYVPKDLIDKKIAIEVAKNSRYYMKFIPQEVIDKDVALAALRQYNFSLTEIPREVIDKEIALLAVQKNGNSLGSVPEEIIDKDIIIEAIKNAADAIQYAPKELIDKEVALAATQKVRVTALQYIPKELIDKEMALKIVQNSGSNIRYIPKKLIDKEVALTAIEHISILPVMKYIPREIIDKEIALAALEKDETARNFIPYELREEVKKELQKRQNSDNNNKLEQNDKKQKTK